MPRVPKAELPPIDLGDESIGQRIAILRKECGYTQKELAEKIGIDRSLITDYERGKIRLYDQMVARFAFALEVSTDEILGLKQNNPKHVKPSLKIMRRLNKIESLPLDQQKTVLKSIDLVIKGAEK